MLATVEGRRLEDERTGEAASADKARLSRWSEVRLLWSEGGDWMRTRPGPELREVRRDETGDQRPSPSSTKAA